MAKVQLGQAVRYVDSNGFEKLAFVTGTRKSVQEGTDVSRPDKGGNAHLFIVAPTGKTYSRENIPQGEGPRTYSLIEA